MRIGALAVLKGWLNQSTVDFMLQHLHPDKAGDSPFLPAK
ncbi:Type II secretory pathway, ATPase PulE/Tfp pilus assembly pathway, ATPase PilB [Crocosphaera watsonii WH 0401]|nr:Type II secretory pathway, ATPase PulE/Tfp pilus assembly pathway, ATPase PilB [Crocosphaera watsonii WH 0401]